MIVAPPPTLSPQRLKMLEFIASRGRDDWSIQEVAAYMGWRTNAGVYNVLNALGAAGFMRRLGRNTWVVTESGEFALAVLGMQKGVASQ